MNRIRIPGIFYEKLKRHLFPGDNKEAVAICLCGRSKSEQNNSLIVQEIFLVPYEACFERRGDFVHWPTNLLVPLLQKAKSKGLGVLKMHCHPGYYEQFSEIDDYSDKELFSSIHSWMDDEQPHASCIMLPDGRIFGRFISDDFCVEVIDQIFIAGSTIFNWHYTITSNISEAVQVRNQQAFGKKTINMLNKLKVGIVGCSGTGSPIIEQLKRLGIRTMILVDPDHMDYLNLNRILNSTFQDATTKQAKVEVMKRSIEEAGFGTTVVAYNTHITNAKVVKDLADCDILFSCVDGAEGRHVLNLISSFYAIPLFDLGVRLIADGEGGIDNIFGSIHYVQPGGSSLLSRKQYTIERLVAEGYKRSNPQEYNERQRHGYLADVNEYSPAVITINMQVASTAMNDLLNRLHPFRNIENEQVSIIRIIFGELYMQAEYEEEPCSFFSRFTGLGDIQPLLNLPELSDDQEAA
ncbi:MAG: hypothetical protein JWQ09_3616 [Segetibacter sp.]|nr:hypothetical protein [Segetibacter sp.]